MGTIRFMIFQGKLLKGFHPDLIKSGSNLTIQVLTDDRSISE
jgi:hypothetical protein